MLNIYIVEDEPEMLSALTYLLQSEGYNVKGYNSGEPLLKKLAISKPDLIILDVMLPESSGFEVCKKIKENEDNSEIPVIFLSSRSDDIDIINGIEFGCDDYITKPFKKAILLAKIKSLISKNKKKQTEKIIKYKLLTINPENHEVLLKGKFLDFTSLEFKVLYYLVSNAGKVYSREQIYEYSHDLDSDSSDRSIDITISKIRKKLESYGQYLESIYGVGYKFKRLN